VGQTKRRATYEELCALPEHLVGEILDGELIASPRPTLPHASASSVIGAELVGPFHRRPGGPHGPGGWWILDEPELHFGSDVLVPDLAGWRQERMPKVPQAPFVELPPDWVCEVISPSTERIDRGRKLRIYARVKVAWTSLVNPTATTLEVLELGSEGWVLRTVHEGAVTVRVPPFEAVELDLSRWWPEP
jgi:Uma2 family endonuclease